MNRNLIARRAVRLGVAACLALTFSPLDASAQWRGRGYAGITVFEHPDFRGTNVTFREEIPDLRQHRLNDRLSSLAIEGNQPWEVCQDINFGGRCRIFSGDVEDLREEGWNDRISSLRPAGRFGGGDRDRGNIRNNRGRNRGGYQQGRLVFYERTNYRGDARDVTGQSANLGSFSDRVRSVEVYGGTWELCGGTSLRNDRCVTITSSVPDLRQIGLGDGVSFVREVAGRNNNRPWWQ